MSAKQIRSCIRENIRSPFGRRGRRFRSGAVEGNCFPLSHLMLSFPPRVTSPSHWFEGPTYYLRRDPLRWIPKWFKDYGDIYKIASPLGQATVVGAPELARQVLVDRYTRYQQKSRAYVVLRILMGNGLVT